MIVIKKPDQETIEKFVELGGIAKMTGDYNLFCKEFPNQGTTAEEIITSFNNSFFCCIVDSFIFYIHSNKIFKRI